MNFIMMKNNINKKEFASIILAKTKLSERQVMEGIDGILAFLNNAFNEGIEIEIRGFGKFNSKNGNVRFKSFKKDEL